jgi:DNA (cytosine-5)-methyltransferase 1
MQAIDFFCGVGGMTCGLRAAEITVVAGVDIDSSCQNSYEVNNPGSSFVEADVTDLTPESLSEQTGIVPHDDDLVFVGCSPCQYWSKVRTDRTKSEVTRALLVHFRRLVDSFRPGYVVVENVPGLARSRNSDVLPTFLRGLADVGYTYAAAVINACHYGVPQTRMRYVLIASRLPGPIALPAPDETPPPTVWDTIGEHNGFPKIPAGHVDPTPFLHTAAGLSEVNLQRISKTPLDGGVRQSWGSDPRLQLPAYRNKDDHFKDVYGRMRWHTPAPTLTTRFHSLSNGRFGHPDENRAISLREGAALQTFPGEYTFDGNQADIARHIGNAVPPELGRRIGVEIIRHRAATLADDMVTTPADD